MIQQYKDRLNLIKEKFSAYKAHKNMYESVLDEINSKLNELTNKEKDVDQALVHIQNINLSLKDDIIKKFESLITEGIKEVFEEDYKIKIEMKKSAFKIIANINIILPNGKEVDIYEGEGGGIKDFVSVLMRIIYFILESEKRSPIIFLDENLKHLDSERALKAIEFIKKITEKFGITVVFITHLNIEFDYLNCNVIKLC